MAKKVFTDESLATFVDEIKGYTDDAVSTKADSSHNHAASNITSGTLSSDRLPTVPITKGGTGATTAAAALTNLGLTATAAEINKLDGLTATTTELNYVDGVTSSIQTQLDTKPDISDLGFARIVACTSSDGVTYIGTTDGITSLTTGLTIIFVSSKTSASTTPTLNINDLGEKSIKRRLSHLSTSTQTGYSKTWLYANKPYFLIYDGTQWIVDGLTKPSAADLYGTLPIEKGGTGATTAAAALTNLGAAPAYTYGTTDLTAGTSALETGTLYFVYE